MKCALLSDVSTPLRRTCLLRRVTESEVHNGGVGHRFGQPAPHPGFPFESTSGGTSKVLDRRVLSCDMATSEAPGFHKGGYDKRVEHMPRPKGENVRTLQALGVPLNDIDLASNRRRSVTESARQPQQTRMEKKYKSQTPSWQRQLPANFQFHRLSSKCQRLQRQLDVRALVNAMTHARCRVATEVASANSVELIGEPDAVRVGCFDDIYNFFGPAFPDISQPVGDVGTSAAVQARRSSF